MQNLPDTSAGVGPLLREWRRHRRLSQLDLSLDAEVSTRHLSCVESGRAAPSREMLLRLAEHLAVPIRERNRLLLAGGFAPLFPERAFEAPEMSAVRAAIDAVLNGHMPFPALAVDRHWNLVTANKGMDLFLSGVEPSLMVAPLNVLRLSLHPAGLAPNIVNLGQWRSHVLHRLAAQATASADGGLAALHAELSALPGPSAPVEPLAPMPVAVPLRWRDAATGEVWSLLSTTTVFGTATDVTLSELALECFYPADEATRAALLAAGNG